MLGNTPNRRERTTISSDKNPVQPPRASNAFQQGPAWCKSLPALVVVVEVPGSLAAWLSATVLCLASTNLPSQKSPPAYTQSHRSVQSAEPFLTACTLLARHLLCKCPAFFNRPSWTTGSKCNNAEAETLSVQRSPLALIGLYVQKGRRSPVIVVDDRWLSIIVATLCSEPTASD